MTGHTVRLAVCWIMNRFLERAACIACGKAKWSWTFFSEESSVKLSIRWPSEEDLWLKVPWPRAESGLTGRFTVQIVVIDSMLLIPITWNEARSEAPPLLWPTSVNISISSVIIFKFQLSTGYLSISLKWMPAARSMHTRLSSGDRKRSSQENAVKIVSIAAFGNWNSS